MLIRSKVKLFNSYSGIIDVNPPADKGFLIHLDASRMTEHISELIIFV